MTVQDLIDRLMEVEDKSKTIGAAFGNDYYTDEITIEENEDSVELS